MNHFSWIDIWRFLGSKTGTSEMKISRKPSRDSRCLPKGQISALKKKLKFALEDKGKFI